jgi:hypothetical protein
MSCVFPSQNPGGRGGEKHREDVTPRRQATANRFCRVVEREGEEKREEEGGKGGEEKNSLFNVRYTSGKKK